MQWLGSKDGARAIESSYSVMKAVTEDPTNGHVFILRDDCIELDTAASRGSKLHHKQCTEHFSL